MRFPHWEVQSIFGFNKIVAGMKISLDSVSRIKGSSLKIKTEMRRNLFIHRIVPFWISLCNGYVEAYLCLFKTTIGRFFNIKGVKRYRVHMKKISYKYLEWRNRHKV